jgi:putative ABC transport system permease protein
VSLGTKAVDDMFVGMNLTLAQQLLYGRQEPKVTAIVIQLNRVGDMPAARARLDALFKELKLDLEVHDYAELMPMYGQIMGFFGAMFGFIAVVMGIIVLFTVVNTMSMSVMERVNEIGTTRALGVRRSGIHRQFLAEGWLLGLFGASGGVILSYVLAFLFNHSGLTWSPPGYSESYPIYLPMGAIPTLVIVVWLALMVMATLAALVPANRAARMPVVDALRHV